MRSGDNRAGNFRNLARFENAGEGTPTVMALSQLSRQVESREDKRRSCRPAQSGSIEQDADMVLFKRELLCEGGGRSARSSDDVKIHAQHEEWAARWARSGLPKSSSPNRATVHRQILHFEVKTTSSAIWTIARLMRL